MTRSKLLGILALSGLAGAASFGVAPAAAERVIRSGPSGTCISSPHETGRVRRMPGLAATTARPRNPSEDHFVHCSEASADDVPAAGRGYAPRR